MGEEGNPAIVGLGSRFRVVREPLHRLMRQGQDATSAGSAPPPGLTPSARRGSFAFPHVGFTKPAAACPTSGTKVIPQRQMATA